MIARGVQHWSIGTAIIPNGDDTYNVADSSGRTLLAQESWQVCCNLQDALLYPSQAWEGSEVDEIADIILRGVA